MKVGVAGGCVAVSVWEGVGARVAVSVGGTGVEVGEGGTAVALGDTTVSVGVRVGVVVWVNVGVTVKVGLLSGVSVTVAVKAMVTDGKGVAETNVVSVFSIVLLGVRIIVGVPVPAVRALGPY